MGRRMSGGEVPFVVAFPKYVSRATVAPPLNTASNFKPSTRNVPYVYAQPLSIPPRRCRLVNLKQEAPLGAIRPRGPSQTCDCPLRCEAVLGVQPSRVHESLSPSSLWTPR